MLHEISGALFSCLLIHSFHYIKKVSIFLIITIHDTVSPLIKIPKSIIVIRPCIKNSDPRFGNSETILSQILIPESVIVIIPVYRKHEFVNHHW